VNVPSGVVTLVELQFGAVSDDEQSTSESGTIGDDDEPGVTNPIGAITCVSP
jgi:hypothetical protein